MKLKPNWEWIQSPKSAPLFFISCFRVNSARLKGEISIFSPDRKQLENLPRVLQSTTQKIDIDWWLNNFPFIIWKLVVYPSSLFWRTDIFFSSKKKLDLTTRRSSWVPGWSQLHTQKYKYAFPFYILFIGKQKANPNGPNSACWFCWLESELGPRRGPINTAG